MNKPNANAPEGAGFKLVPIADLHEDPANARGHDEKNKAAVRSSLKEFGQVEALVVQRGTGRVIGGNCRLGELRAMGVEEVWVCEVDASDVKAARLGIALNRTAELAHWEDDTLRALLTSLDDTSGLGFDNDELEGLMADLSGMEETEGDDDAVAPPAEADSVVGTVYQLGPHRLACGDSTDASTWEALAPGEVFDAVWTDPPYGVSYVGKTEDAMVIENDDLKPDELAPFLAIAMGEVDKRCRPGAAWYVAAPSGDLFYEFGTVLGRHGLGIWRHTLVWMKDRFVMGRADYHYQHEAIFYGWKPGGPHFFIPERTHSTTLEFARPSRNDIHPTMKPVALVEYCLKNSTKTGWLVAEPFGGSGTTLIACAKLGLRARVVELSPNYCDAIRIRWTNWARENGVDPGEGALDAPHA